MGSIEGTGTKKKKTIICYYILVIKDIYYQKLFSCVKQVA
jgi:hypothetical protein